MQGNGKRTDEHGIFALAAHLLGEQFGMRFAETGGRGQLEIPVGTLLARRFMRDDENAGGLGLGKDRLEHLGIVRHDADDLDPLRDQILDGAHLQGRVSAGRADHEGIEAKLGALLLDAGIHRVEPRDTADLDDDADLVGCKRRKRDAQATAMQQALQS